MSSQLFAYLDESSALRPSGQQEYMVCAAIIEAEELERVRQELLPLRLPGQIKLHWTDEREARRRRIVDVVASVESMQAIITHRSEFNKKTERYRRKCLEQMYFELSVMPVDHVILESRDASQNKRDIEHIVALQGQNQCKGLRVQHQRGGDEPLLWIADVVLGSLNALHNGTSEHWEALCDKVVLSRQTPDSIP